MTRTYEAERPCGTCCQVVPATVVVLSPGRIAYLGDCGHDWVITCPLPPVPDEAAP